MNLNSVWRFAFMAVLVAGAAGLQAAEVERGTFRFQVSEKWAADMKAEGSGLGSHKEPGNRAWLYHALVKSGEAARAEDGLVQLLGTEFGTYLKDIRLRKVSYCDEKTKLDEGKKDKRKDKKKDKGKDKKDKKGKKKDKKDKKDKDKGDGAASDFCKNPTYWGKGKAKSPDDKKLRFRFIVVEKDGKAIVVVGAAKHEYAKEKEKDKELRKMLQSVH